MASEVRERLRSSPATSWDMLCASRHAEKLKSIFFYFSGSGNHPSDSRAEIGHYSECLGPRGEVVSKSP